MRIYLCLSYCARIRGGESEIEAQLDSIATHKKAIERTAEMSHANYKAYHLLLTAEIADVKGDQYEGDSIPTPSPSVTDDLQPLRRMKLL
jgi:hypothetical protein